MATYDDEKSHGNNNQYHDASLSHTDTQDEGSLSDEKHKLEQKKTLSEIDVENKAAFKGDDSDGAVDWTVRNILASIFLCMLYTGTARIHVTHRSLLTGIQALRSFCTLSEDRSNSSFQICMLPTRPYGYLSQIR